LHGCSIADLLVVNNGQVRYTEDVGFYLSLPLLLLKFWYIEAPYAIIVFFASLNRAFLRLFSLPLLIRTYFRPWKNEYREGLVGFSIAMGIFIKTFVIAADLFMFFTILITEVLLFIAFLAWPIAAILWILF